MYGNKFLVKLAYLSDTSLKLRLNLQTQGTNTRLPHLAGKVRRLETWEQQVEDGNVDSLEDLKSFAEDDKLQDSVISCMKAHMLALQKHFLVQDSKDPDGSMTRSVQRHLLTPEHRRRSSSLMSRLVQQ